MNTTLKILTLAVGLAAAGPWDLYANTTSPALLRASSAKIGAANDRAYDELLKSRRADSVVLVDINPDAINETTDTFSLGLKGMSNIAYRLSAEKTPSGSIVWQGTFGKRSGAGDFLKQRLTGEIAVDPMNFVQVTRHKDAFVGSMRYNGESYELVPTTKGHAFIKVNPRFASHCGQHAASNIGDTASQHALPTMKSQSGPLNFSARATTVYTAKIVFGVTKDALASMGGTTAKVQARLDSVIATTNSVFTTTGLTNVKVQMSGIYFLNNYTSGVATTDLDAIRTSQNTAMIGFRKAKSDTKADIAALVGTSYGGGLAAVLPGTAAYSNLVFSLENDLVFAHEVGHIYGAGHQPGSGSVSVPYARAAFVSTGSYPFKTLMNSSITSQTIKYFSNVDYKYQNQAMGSTSQNNKFVVLTNAPKITALAN